MHYSMDIQFYSCLCDFHLFTVLYKFLEGKWTTLVRAKNRYIFDSGVRLDWLLKCLYSLIRSDASAGNACDYAMVIKIRNLALMHSEKYLMRFPVLVFRRSPVGDGHQPQLPIHILMYHQDTQNSTFPFLISH